MINKKLILALIASGTIVGASFAMYRQGNWQGKGQGHGFGKMITQEEKSKLQSMNWEERQEYVKQLKEKYNFKGGKHGKGKEKGHNPAKMLENIEKQDLNATEVDLLKKQYEEEMMSNELYNSFYEKYGLEVFKNIANSEAKHMQAVKTLLDRYGIEVPTNYNHLKDLYEKLKEEGSKSAKDAFEVGIKIEMLDIEDISKTIKSTDNNDIKIVFTNIGGASYNHLRGFVKTLKNNGYETNLNWKDYISEEDLSVKGPIKYKLAEKLEKEGVKLPEQVSSENMKKKCKKHGEKGKHKKHGKKHNKVKQYKKLIEQKYGKKLDSFSQEKMKEIINKIDTLLETISTSGKYSESKKVVYIDVLTALKEALQDRLEKADSTEIIDSLLK